MAIAYGVGGARTQYGPRDVAKKEAARTVSFGIARQIVVDFDFANLPSTLNAGADAVNAYVPAGSFITRCYLYCKTAGAGGTSYTVGLEQADGTDIDADGLITAAQGAVANLAQGNVIAGRGALVLESPNADGTSHGDADGVYADSATGPVTSVDGYIVVVPSGTFTAGSYRLFVEYVPTAAAV